MQLMILTFLPDRDAFCSAQNAPNPSGEVYDAPIDPLVEWGWRCPLLINLLPRRPLASRSHCLEKCPEFPS